MSQPQVQSWLIYFSHISRKANPLRTQDAKLGADYNYDDSAGKDSRVYIVDSRLSPSHHEFSLQEENLEWLWAGPFQENTLRDDCSPLEHGTAVGSQDYKVQTRKSSL